MNTNKLALEALKPFAALLQSHNNYGVDATPLFAVNEAMITRGDLRRVVAAIAQLEAVQIVTEGMIQAYLEANNEYWRETDAQQSDNPSKWRNGTPLEATRVSLEAALASRSHQIAEPASPWVSVSERLPVWVVRDDTPCFINGKEIPPTLFSETVLVALKGGGVRTDKLTTIEGKSKGWWHTYGERVAAWMQAPKPPTQKEPS